MNWQNTTSSPNFQETHACCCIGPQNGEPVCPCRMKYVTIKDGRYVSITDLGPAPAQAIPPGNYRVVTGELFRVEEGEPCMHDGVKPDQVMGLACPCPKCSPRC